ncbi:dipeptide epimerase [Halobacteriaceae archaeon GCM10025711]
MSTPCIEAVRAKPLDRRLTSSFEISLGTQTALQNVAVEVETTDGITGVGEAAPVPHITGETQETALAAVETAAEVVDGMAVADVRGISNRLGDALSAQRAARAGVEIAVFDALTRSLDVSLAAFVGGRNAPVRTDDTIGLVTPDAAATDARDAVAAGFDELKIKIGEDVERDLARVEAVRDAAPAAGLKVDANQGYTPADAIAFADRAREHGLDIDLFEQPVPADAVGDLRRVRDAVRIPVAADESVFSREDAARIATMDAADVINVKLAKTGVVETLDIVSLAVSHDLELMIGCMLESSIGLRAAAHIVAGTGAFSSVDLDGNTSLEADVVESSYGPTIPVAGPGIGVDVDFDTL